MDKGLPAVCSGVLGARLNQFAPSDRRGDNEDRTREGKIAERIEGTSEGPGTCEKRRTRAGSLLLQDLSFWGISDDVSERRLSAFWASADDKANSCRIPFTALYAFRIPAYFSREMSNDATEPKSSSRHTAADEELVTAFEHGLVARRQFAGNSPRVASNAAPAPSRVSRIEKPGGSGPAHHPRVPPEGIFAPE